ncbi:SDR family NAD(P)-dependent oxidoreductase [Actinophytocola sp.]|uniref:SDR family NAD(P)-dependent oxidoreductase n=1 Tax=Actinophytocola sp. TaxID=1872138 RepID=UPI0039C88C92
MTRSLAQAWVGGAPVDWSGFVGGGSRVELPVYPFQRRRFWLDAPTGGGGMGAATGHALLGGMVRLADSGGVVFTGSLSTRTHPWLADHTVLDTVLLPATAFVDLAIRAGDEVDRDRVEELTLEAPLVLGDEPVDLQVVVGPPEDGGAHPVTIHSRPSGTEDWTRHATGLLTRGATTPAPLPWPPIQATPITVDDLYRDLADNGLDYGPLFRGLRAAWRHGADVIAEVALPNGSDTGTGTDSDTATATDGFGIHPALLDAALHGLALTDQTVEPGAVLLPFTWTGVSLHATGSTSLRVRITPDGALTATDTAGQPVITVDALVLRPVSADRLRVDRGVRSDSLFTVDWVPVALPEPGPEPTPFDPDLDPVPDVMVARLEGGSPRELAADALHLVQTFTRQERFADSRLLVVTEGAVAVDGRNAVTDVAAAAVWGLVRSAQSEHPGRFVLADIDGTVPLGALPALDEPQVAVRGGQAFVPRVTAAADQLTPPDQPGWRLDVVSPGTVDGAALIPSPESVRPLDAGEVRVAVRAAGLNFRDVVLTLGMLADQEVMGSEGAGVVVETAPDVTDLRPGDRVMGLFPGAFGPYAIADHRMVVPVPPGWTFATAASVPVAFLTAWYGLVDIAALQPGERVLVHAGAGGVGMAAIQLARHLGAEVFATASPAKWDTLRALGLDDDHIASSRTTDFEHEFRAAGGFDVVLNSLAGEFVDASLRVLSPGGRFVELGKTDLRDPGAGIAYRAFDLVEAGPQRTGELLHDVLDLMSHGDLAPLPLTTWDVRHAPEALRWVSRARHVGKIVLTVPAPLDPAGTVLITGGTGVLGGLVARGLVTEHGVRRLVLTSRRGGRAPGAERLVAELTELGAEVTVAECDVANRDSLSAVLVAARADLGPLTAVVHAAGVLDDGILDALTPDRLDLVMRPKVDAVDALHELTLGDDLAAFVLFSSASATFGGAGQANYAAANAYLDAFAQRRRAAGLPAQSLAWGLWADRSEMTGDLGAADVARMGRAGVVPLSTEEGLSLFDTALRAAPAVLLPMRLDLPALRAAADGVPALLRGLVGTRRAAASPAGGGPALARRLAGLSPGEQDAVLLDLVRSAVAAVLGHTSGDAVPVGKAFKELGFDSLTAVELRNRLNAASGLRLPVTVVFDHSTPAALAEHLRTELVPDAETTGEATDPEETRIRAAIAGLPVSRLRDAGVLDVLLGLAGLDTATGTDQPAEPADDSIDAMDAQTLVRMALQQTQS